jgi:hypothetical protein
MAKGKRVPNQFTIIERHPEQDDAPTLDELNQTLHDWYRSVVITGEHRNARTDEKEVVPPTEKDQQE